MGHQGLLSTGINGFDHLLSGGILPGSSLFVTGSLGTGKTVLSLHFLVTGARTGQKGLYISLIDEADNISFSQRDVDLEFYRLAGKKQLYLHSLAVPDNQSLSELEKICVARNIKRVVLDGLNFNTLDRSPELGQYADTLKKLGVTVSILYGIPLKKKDLAAPAKELTFRCDYVIRLDQTEEDQTVQRRLQLLKTRGKLPDLPRALFTITQQGMVFLDAPPSARKKPRAKKKVFYLYRPFCLLGKQWQAYLEGMARVLQDRFPGYKFELINQTPRYLESYLTKEQNDIGIVLVHFAQVADIAEKGLLLRLDEALPEKKIKVFKDRGLTACRYQGRLYSLPHSLDISVLCCNNDLLKKYHLSLPRTWEELRYQIQHILHQEKDKELDGLLIPSHNDLNYLFLETLWSLGGDLFDQHGLITLNSETGLQALQLIRELFIIPNLINYRLSLREAITKFFNGKGIFFRFSADSYIWGRSLGLPGEPEILTCRLRSHGLIKKYGAIITGTSIGVPQYTRYPDVALQVLEVFTNFNVNRELYREAGFPWGMNAFKKFRPSPKDPNLPVILEEVESSGFALSQVRSYVDIKGMINSEISDMINKGKPPERCLQRIYEQLWLSCKKGKYQVLVEKAASFLESHYNRPLFMEELCRSLQVSQRHLNRIFNMTKGCSCKEYLMELRINKARDLLKFTDLSINEIARQVGYPDPYGFSRIFKKKTGHSPRAFRAA